MYMMNSRTRTINLTIKIFPTIITYISLQINVFLSNLITMVVDYTNRLIIIYPHIHRFLHTTITTVISGLLVSTQMQAVMELLRMCTFI